MPDLDRLVEECRAAVGTGDARHAVRDVLEQALADGWLRRLLDDPTPGIRLLHQAPDLTVLDVAWPPGVRIVPHDHLMWAAIAVYGGREANTFWRREGDGILEGNARELIEGEIAFFGAEMMHSVHNPSSTSYTGAVHVYGGDLVGSPHSMWVGDAHREERYDFAFLQAELDRAESRFQESTRRQSP